MILADKIFITLLLCLFVCVSMKEIAREALSSLFHFLATLGIFAILACVIIQIWQ